MILRGSASRARRAQATVLAGAFACLAASCDKVPLLAPTASIITLAANESVLPINGTTDVTAIVIESAGTAVQNGTLVTFTSTLGSLEPFEARTNNGRVTVRFVAGSRSGSATINASTGGAKTVEDAEPLTIRIGAAAAGRISLIATPNALPAVGGTAQILAHVFDINGNSLPGVQVGFSLDAGATGSGTLSTAAATTDANGEARTTLTTVVDTIVTADVGGGGGEDSSGATASVTVRVNPLPTVAITVSPANPVEDAAVTFTLTPGTGITLRSAKINFGDGSSANLGSIGSATTVQHTYKKAGTFKVTVSGEDSRGEEFSTSTVVTVSKVAPVSVTIAVTPTGTLEVQTPVTFTATVVPAVAPTSVRWSFGDGTSATTTGLQTSHVYGTTGRKTVKVTIETVANGTGTGQVDILIESTQ
jgi:PKD repeat protein